MISFQKDMMGIYASYINNTHLGISAMLSAIAIAQGAQALLIRTGF
ncbi:MAG: hypothetical protein PUP91_21835 [Rhizonema sp. PD37]|nr:hypothetical protein [Rhizonema sp. PD37]